MKKILIVQNVSGEGPGILEDLLRERKIYFDLVDLDRGDFFPDSKGYAAWVVLGGPDSANDDTPKMKKELECVRRAVTRKIPYLGICLGLQTLVKAMGGRVIKNPVKELGFRDSDGNIFSVDLTAAGQSDPLLKGFKERLSIFHLHGETVVLTPSMQLLGEGKFCENQIVKVGPKAYGIQGHFELTAGMLQDWLDADPDLKTLNRPEVERDFEGMRVSYTQTGLRLFENFLKIAGF